MVGPVTDTELWTIDELAERVADTLRNGRSGRANGRVREVPDRRTIRWYTTIGLLDRPTAMRGRTALYGRRHLLQIVAVKRLQGRGRSLAEVQRDLLGATDTALVAIAGELPAPSGPGDDGSEAGPGRAERFWAARGTAPTGAGQRGDTTGPASRPTPRPAPEPATAATPVPAVALGGGVTLLLHAAAREPAADDLAAIAQAAAPLLELLRARGLDEPNGTRGTR